MKSTQTALLTVLAAIVTSTALSNAYAIDWNKEEPGLPGKGGDPLVFSLSDKPVKITRNWLDQHESFLTDFDLFAIGKNVVLDRTISDDTMTLFLDFDENRQLSDGTEWLFDQNEDVYEILARDFIDSNNNGWFDYSDNLWSIAMIKKGDTYMTPEDLEIIGFNWSNAKHFKNDRYGIGQYSDCRYEGVLHTDCEPVSTEHFRIKAHNANGVLLRGGETFPTFGSVVDWLKYS